MVSHADEMDGSKLLDDAFNRLQMGIYDVVLSEHSNQSVLLLQPCDGHSSTPDPFSTC